MKNIVVIWVLMTFIVSCTNQDHVAQIDALQTENDRLKTLIENINQEKMRLEINMIVSDAKAAADYYQKVLQAEIISKTDNEAGMNETMMKLGDVEVRVLDENKDMGMIAPAQVGGQSMGINLFVSDIDAFMNNAIEQGCKVLSPVTEFPEIPAKNAVFSDQFNHLWVVNQQY